MKVQFNSFGGQMNVIRTYGPEDGVTPEKDIVESFAPDLAGIDKAFNLFLKYNHENERN